MTRERAIKIAHAFVEGWGEPRVYAWRAGATNAVFREDRQHWVVSLEADPRPADKRPKPKNPLSLNITAALMDAEVEITRDGDIVTNPWPSLKGW